MTSVHMGYPGKLIMRQFLLLLHDLEANASDDLDNTGLITQEDVDTSSVKLYP